LPDVADGRAELDSFDGVEGLVIQGGIPVEVLNGVSLHGGLVVSWPHTVITAQFTVESLVEHWRAVGLPGYAQFDNDPIFEGAQIYPDTIGRVARTCLGLGVVPVFVPPRETGFQAAIEGYNGRWQAKVWARFHHESLQGCKRNRPATWPRIGSAVPHASRRHRRGVPFPAAGSWTCKPIPRGAWSSCGGATRAEKCSCWGAPSPWTRCGSIGWFVPM